MEHLDPESLHLKRWGLIAGGTSFTRKFSKGQVLFGKRRAYQRKAAVAEFDGICSGDILVFEPKNERLLPELLPFIVQSDRFFEHALRTSAGSLSPRTKWRDLANYEFPLPPLDEQRRIAEILWAADELVEKKRTVLQNLGVLRQAVIDQLFQVSIDKSVKKVKLRNVSKMQNGRAYPSKDYREDGIKLLRPGNLGQDGYFDWREDVTRFLPSEYKKTASDYLIRPGDVVINLTAQSLEDGFMGRVCLAQGKDYSLLNQRIGRFVCNGKILPEYLYRCLQTSNFRHRAETYCEGSKIKHLYWQHLKDFQIPLPSINKQTQLIKKAATVDRTIKEAAKNWELSQELSHSLREDLLNVQRSEYR